MANPKGIGGRGNSYPERKVYEKLRHAMRALHYQQSALAAKLGVHANRVGKWLDDIGCPDAVEMELIAQALDVPVRYFIDEAIPTKPLPRAKGDVWGNALAKQDEQVLEIARRIGVDEAINRLVGVGANLGAQIVPQRPAPLPMMAIDPARKREAGSQ